MTLICQLIRHIRMKRSRLQTSRSEHRPGDQGNVTVEDQNPDVSLEDLGLDMSFVVGDDGMLTLQPPDSQSIDSDSADVNSSTTNCPSALALAALESSLTPRKRRKFEECFNCNVDLSDRTLNTWKDLKLKNVVNDKIRGTATDNSAIVSSATEVQNCDPQLSAMHHPLDKAGLIPENLVNILVTPPPAKTTTIRKTKGKAKLLTSADVQEIEERETKKKQETEEQIKKATKRREKKAMRELELKKRKKKSLSERKLERNLRKNDRKREKRK